MFQIWEAMGGEDWQLIEPVDGFHMNQIANYLLSDEMLKIFTEKHPEWLGPINQYNDKIKEIFGDQGGY